MISIATFKKTTSLVLIGFSTFALASLAACATNAPNTAAPEIEAPTEQEHAAEHDDSHFTYSGETGPEHWASLSAEFEKCGSGTVQSPINIKNINVSPIAFGYKDTPLTTLNNGHTIQVNYEPGSTIKIDEQSFELLQFHFHTPSENTLDGKAFDMEMHLVHQDANGKLGVVGVFFEKGIENPALKTILDHLPKEENKAETFSDMKINATSLLPKDQQYYGFDGSLTTPPCSEGVEWRVMKSPLQMSAAQLDTFHKLFHDNNARPTQPLNGREAEISA